MIRVLIVDDHAVVRSGLRRVLESEADIEVVGEAGTADQAIYETVALKPGAASGAGLGLVGMRERIALLGGTLTLETDGAGGTTLVAEVPL